MPTPREIQNIRISNDYKKMCNLLCDAISWIPIIGEPPYIKEYKIILRIRTIVGLDTLSAPIYRDCNEVILKLPENYPYGAPQVIMKSPIFHPDWYEPFGNQTDYIWSCGMWNAVESLDEFVIRMVKSMQFEISVIALQSSSNNKACQWVLENLNTSLFPCDKSILPDLETSR